MIRPRDGERYVSICDLGDLDTHTLMRFERHKLSGTPFTLDQALMVVCELCTVEFVNDSRGYDPDLLDNRVDTEVVDFLTDDGDDSADIDNYIYNRVVDQSIRAIDELYLIVGPSILHALRREYDHRDLCDQMYADVIGVELHGRNGLAFCLEFNRMQDL